MDKEDLITVQLQGEIGFTLICAGPLPRILRGRIFELRLTESLAPDIQALRRHAVCTNRAAGRQTGLRFAMERFRRASNAAAGKGRNDCGTFKGETAIRRAPTASGHSARGGSQMRAGSAGHHRAATLCASLALATDRWGAAARGRQGVLSGGLFPFAARRMIAGQDQPVRQPKACVYPHGLLQRPPRLIIICT
jgi:hypothetical protein